MKLPRPPLVKAETRLHQNGAIIVADVELIACCGKAMGNASALASSPCDRPIGWPAAGKQGACSMRRFAIAVVGAGSLAFAGQALAQETDNTTFTASATTQEAIAVSCSQNLNFGTLAVDPNGATAATVTVAASSGATASSNNPEVYVVDGGQVAVCTVSGENGTDGTASLAATGAGAFSVDTLPAVPLEDQGAGTGNLSADITLSSATGIGDGDLYIGGALTVPAGHAVYSTYQATVTLTVTD